MGSVYDIGHNAINGPPASAGALGVVQGEDPGEDSWRRRHSARTDLGVGPGVSSCSQAGLGGQDEDVGFHA